MPSHQDRPIFAGDRVAIIGATDRVHYHGALIANLTADWSRVEKIYLINPNRDTAFGRPCYDSVGDVREAIDVAVIATPSRVVAEAVEECGLAGVATAIVLSSGFAEAGPDGLLQQAAASAAARKYGMHLLGPSSLGFVARARGVAPFASRLPRHLDQGNVSAVFQSGGMLNLFLHQLADRRIGLCSAVVTGNEASLSLSRLFREAVRDDGARVVALYCESIHERDLLVQACEEAQSLGKPVIALRAGTSAQGQRNVATHSGKLASSSRAWTALLRQRNVIEVHNLDDLIEAVCVASRTEGLKIRPTRRRACLMSVSGGDCTLLADIAERTGWQLPDLKDDAHQRMVALTGKHSMADNPLDVGGLWRKGVIGDIAGVAAAQYDVDVIGFRLNLPEEPDDGLLHAYRDLVVAARKEGKLPVALTRASERVQGHWYEFFQQLGVPFLHEYEKALRALGRISDWYGQRAAASEDAGCARGTVDLPAIERFRGRPSGAASFDDASELLRSHGIHVIGSRTVTTREDALAAAAQVGYPVVLKADSPAVLHRSDIGAVRLNITSPAELTSAYNDIHIAVDQVVDGWTAPRFVVQQQEKAGLELLVGVRSDPEIGPVVLLALGGIYAELLDDVALRPAPVTAADVEEMLSELRARQLLEGARGTAKLDVAAVVNTVIQLGAIADSLGDDLAELDVNPLIVREAAGGAVAVDVVAIRA